MPTEIIWPQLETSTFQKQKFHSKLEIRGGTSDPTSMLQLTFMTLETSTLKEKVLGFSSFPIYIDSVTKSPVLQRNTNNDVN